MQHEPRLSLEALENYNRPLWCDDCGGIMLFKGCGEYHCENCGKVDYDDYGKARLYLEEHIGANMSEISDATGVSQKNIRLMIKESRFEVRADSRTFMQCEICRCAIRSGRYCAKCEQKVHERIEAEERRKIQAKPGDMQGFGKAKQGEKGEKRFTR